MRKTDLRAAALSMLARGIERHALFYEDGDGVVLRCRDGDAEEVERVPATPVADR